MNQPAYAATYYAATAHPQPLRPSASGDADCDVCVVGAGFSGISTALHLAEQGLKVIVLESDRIGFGASGRNGGQIINGYSRGYDTIKSRYGADTANALRQMGFEGGDIIRERVRQYGIDCDLRDGAFFAAFNDKQMKELEHKKSTWDAGGQAKMEMFDAARTRGVVNTDLYCGGLMDHRGGHVHSLNLVLGQAAALEKRGGRVHEGARVLSVDTEAPRPVVKTDQARITADFVVVCGNAYLGDAVPQLSSRIMSVSSQVVATEPLGADLARSLMPHGACVEDCNYLMDYYRITADHRLLFGGGVVYSGHTPSNIKSRLWPHILRTFPQLRDRKIDFAWSGNFALTLTRIPHVGRMTDKVYFIQGDNGHGVTTCHLLGRIVAESIAQQHARFDVWAGMKNYPFPGGRMFRVPLTALGAWYYGLREKLGL